MEEESELQRVVDMSPAVWSICTNRPDVLQRMYRRASPSWNSENMSEQDKLQARGSLYECDSAVAQRAKVAAASNPPSRAASTA